MKFIIRYNNNCFEIEAESLVHALIKAIDFGFGITNEIEFKISDLKNDN